ncbi:MAG: PA0069 family radical SAM protein [Pseudomonadota bacterium]
MHTEHAVEDEIPFRAGKGRGALSNHASRFETCRQVPVDDGWWRAEETESAAANRTRVCRDTARTLITRNTSPDVPFELSVNPYRGCEHGCVYCFARPSHAWLGLSPGLDFETRLFCKPDAGRLLAAELARPGYRCRPIALGINTDGWQPVERRLRITRQLLQVLHDCDHPCSVVTKSALIERDIELLAAMAQKGLVQVAVSLTTLQGELARSMEPRAATPQRRLQTMRTLAAAGVPVSVLVAPLIPVLTDGELETLLGTAREAGAQDAGYVLLRMPHEIKDLFREWLEAYRPGMAQHVFRRMSEAHGGKLYAARFGTRMTGGGAYADMLARRFALARKRLGFQALPALETRHFRRPGAAAQQALF